MARPPNCASCSAASSSSASLWASPAAWRRGSGAVESATKIDSTPRIASTTSISISVKPRRGARGSERPVADVGIEAFSAGDPVRAVAEHVDLAMQAGIQVLVGLAPRVQRQFLHIASGLPVLPYPRLARPGNQRLDSLFRRRIAFAVQP